jgi:hypothetical protein
MKLPIILIFFVSLFSNLFAQNVGICLTNDAFTHPPKFYRSTNSINNKKIIRINYHFILRANGTGNFTELNDGNGNSAYNGYMFANDLTNWMNGVCSWNEQMRIPTGNTTPVIAKNFSFVLDGVYFWRDDATYNFASYNANYAAQGQNKDSVLNIFLTYDNSTNISVGGYASDLDANSKIKYTENRCYWQRYHLAITSNTPMEWAMHGTGSNTVHELCHLLGLSHTVKWNGGGQCGTGCPGYTAINTACDDGCADTPTAWSIMNANNCTTHPDCGWNTGSLPNCSNNVMDYSGANALTPCQLSIIHASLEGGMRSYLSCAAVANDLQLCDISYPKVSYFGRNVSIGCSATPATVANNEKISLFFSNSVELTNFEVSTNSEFEVILESVCAF